MQIFGSSCARVDPTITAAHFASQGSFCISLPAVVEGVKMYRVLSLSKAFSTSTESEFGI